MDDFKDYILNNAVPAAATMQKAKELYLDAMVKSISGYSFSDIEQNINKPINDFQNIFKGYSRIGMSRLLNVMAFLIKKGRMSEMSLFWHRLMRAVLSDIKTDVPKSGVEFLILELCSAIYVMGPETKGCSEHIEALRAIDPYEKYDSTLAAKPPGELHNFCMYGICAEYLRGMLTGIDTDAFISRHWEVQKGRFNENGRYMDPGCPMVYDITSRYRLALMLKLGYNGTAAQEMRDVLRKGAYNLLFQMSADYKFPYGGRSNQYNFNECLAASMFEYYAADFYERDDVKTAGLFKYSATKSIEGLSRWLLIEPAGHIKNMFPTDSQYGIDHYGTYERYMVTMGAFVSGALLFENDEIPMYCLPAESTGLIMADYDEFHKVFASCGGYSVEIDPDGDSYYDSSGLGRLHYYGAPVELALSMPFASNHRYLLGSNQNTRGRSISVFWEYDGAREYLAESFCGYEVKIIEEQPGSVKFSIEYIIKNRGKIQEVYELNASGLKLSCASDFADISYCVPIFKNNGRDEGLVFLDAGSCSVELDGWKYLVSFESDAKAEFCDYLLYNRNGIYKELNIINKKNIININLSIKGAKK